jgi:MraZ protein
VGIGGKPHFRGQSLATLDEKGRLRIPARFREVLQKHRGDTLIVTMMDGYLVSYPLEAWEKFEEKALALSQIQPQQRDFVRFVISGAVECEFDRQGRILIPPILREEAGLEREVFLAGMLTSFEIWAKPKWDEQLKLSKANYRQIAEEIATHGL